MKKSILLLGFSITALCGFGQADIAGVLGHQRTAGRFCGWAPGLGSIPGSLEIRNDFNFPITFHTNGFQRLKLNHSVSYDINGASGTNLSREGYLLLGKNNNFSSTANPIYKEGAFSLLHLNGYNGNTIDELGYRNWMQTGITFTGNRDLLRYRSVS